MLASLLPPWNGSHPLVIHTPIALGVLAPAFALVGVLRPKWRGWSWATLAMLLIATVGIWLAYYSGESGEAYIRANTTLTPEADTLLSSHHVAGGQARLVLTFAAAIFAAWMWCSGRRDPRPVLIRSAATVAVLALGFAAFMIVRAAHMGGQLVHVHAMLAPQ